MRALIRFVMLTVLVAATPSISTASGEDATYCDGRPVTITGEPGGTVVGTPGDDVIVTGGAVSVSAGAGDDTVCATGEVSIDLGAGDDVALVAGDEVTNDSVDGGSGQDRLDIGVDSDDGTRPDWVVDDAQHSITRGAIPVLRVTAVENYFLHMTAHDLTFRGDSSSESVAVDNVVTNETGEEEPSFTGTFSATMGAGDDTVDVPANVPSTADGGPGEDRIIARGTSHHYAPIYESYYLSSDYIHLDLGRGTLKFDTDVPASPIASFEDATAVSDLHFGQLPPVVVVGTNGPNRLEVDCGGDDSRLLGRGGDDVLSAAGTLGCSTAHPKQLRRTLLGGAGDDVLRGWFGIDMEQGGPGADRMYGGPDADRLNGGPGDDLADGGRGCDTCRAEERHACER